jgi:predicted site-specific integrase-resolvase
MYNVNSHENTKRHKQMKEAAIYARVSSKEQEGFSIPAQLKFLHEYAFKNEFHVAHEFEG